MNLKFLFSNSNSLNNNYFTLILVLFSFVNLSESLYEDQIGKFDWKQSYIGKTKYAYFDNTATDRIIIATEQNVLAALSVKTGEILWRKVFEKNTRGEIKLLHVQSDQNSITQVNSDTDIITVSGVSPALIRGWDPSTGHVKWEWSLTPNSLNYADQALWFYDNFYIYHIVPVYNSHIEVTAYYGSTGQQVKPTSSKISAAWITAENCVLAAPFYACLIRNQIIAINLISDKSELITRILERDVTGLSIQVLHGGTIVVGEEIILLHDVNYVVRTKGSPIIFKTTIDTRDTILKAELENKAIQITTSFVTGEDLLNAAHISAPFQDSLGTPTIYDVRYKVKPDGQIYYTSLLLATDNGAIALLYKGGKIKWLREEALADIVAVEMIDLPLSDAEGAIENELKNKDGDVFGAFIRRVSSQIIHTRNLILTVFGLGAPPSASQKAGLIRDAFGLHKMIVAITSSGKIFGIDNITGKHHWVKYLSDFTSFNNGQNMQILVQRTSRHFPHPAQCVIIARSKKTGKGLLYQFNPISGQPVNSGVIKLDFEIQQTTLLHETESDFSKGMLLFDKDNQIHVIPESSAKLAHAMYLYTADKATGNVAGYFIEYKIEKLNAKLIWQINLGGSGNTHKITHSASKNPIEHVHSQGRVLNDRSVLYKYINPNLVAIATQGPDVIHKYILNVHLIDVVSGAIISSMTHRKVKGPVHMVHSENWLVYSYYNEKVRRTEITTIELYEGKTQANSTIWSSLDAPPLPMVERQSYIIPGNVVALKETITEKGITNKHVLVALSTGGIIEMPWAFLDPRRPSLIPNQAREEGIMPYIPELQLPSENVINYNQSIANIQGIYTAPSGLESTCLIVAYGLDLFVSRIAPSKTFDLLKEDFDYMLISVVLAALTIASCIVKHLSSRKAIKQAWK